MLNMWGINLYTGGHYDNYIVNYYGYREGPAPEGTFDKPDICPDKPEPGEGLTPHHKQAGVHAQIRRMLPNPHHGEISLPPHKLLTWGRHPLMQSYPMFCMSSHSKLQVPAAGVFALLRMYLAWTRHGRTSTSCGPCLRQDIADHTSFPFICRSRGSSRLL